MEFTQVIENRYSCKNFSARQLAPAQLDAILAAGRVAPTAKNLQEQRIYVIQSAQGLAKIDAATPCRYGAPTCLVVAFDRSSVFYISRRQAGLRRGGCIHCSNAPDAGRRQRRWTAAG